MFKSIRFATVYLAISSLILLASDTWVHAQTYTQGSIAGTVFDASDAVVANAAITIHNVGTNAETQLTTDGSGFFKAPQLPAAIYTVTRQRARLCAVQRSERHRPGRPDHRSHPPPAGRRHEHQCRSHGEAPILNFESPDISTVLTETQP